MTFSDRFYSLRQLTMPGQRFACHCGTAATACSTAFAPVRQLTSHPQLKTAHFAPSLQAMEGLVEEGLVKHIGVSNFSIKKIKDVLSYAKIKPAVNQASRY